jgi:hypothetical protein
MSTGVICSKYLDSRAFFTRYVLAAHFVRDCRAIVEIGGAATPIDRFLTGARESVLILDPLIRESYSVNFQDLENSWAPRCDRAIYVLEPA